MSPLLQKLCPQFTAAPGTPTVNGLTGALLTNNPNGVNPFRLTRAQAATCDQDHDYTDEQTAFDFGLMDNFLALVPSQFCTHNDVTLPNEIMGYFDGNTVTALWNYAQNFAMNDNSFSTTFGPSTSSKNIGDLLNAAGDTWGRFQGGFDLTITNPNGTTGCARSTTSAVTGVTKVDYIPHHEPFQYFTSTRNPNHTRPTNVNNIGFTDGANHQYDIHDFFDAVGAGHMPQVSFLKAAGFQDGHASRISGAAYAACRLKARFRRMKG